MGSISGFSASAMKTLSLRAKEDVAQKLLDKSRLMKKIEECARQGYETVVITPKSPIELHLTKTAERTTKELEAAGFCAVWECETVVPLNNDNSTGVAQRQSSLVISWSNSLGLDRPPLPRIVDLNKVGV